ncbi:MAG TPA: DUF4157 domain-containing protein [Trebonia sp.]|jgi:hypothetical protein|nr:DUF4157 domain-containing protein [Trebonia sp.]
MRFHGHEAAGEALQQTARAAAAAPSAAPQAAGPAALLRLQRTLGNQGAGRVVQRLAASRPARVPARPGGLPARLLTSVARESGLDLSDVSVHRSSAEPRRVDARAYAAGSDIHLAPGADRHLAHEAWHLVQQRQGRVPVTGRASGRALNTDPGLEREADVMGDRLAAGPGSGPAQGGVAAEAAPPPAVAPLQLKSEFTKKLPREKNAATPIATLSAVFGRFFTSAGEPELYNFSTVSPFINVSPAKYAGIYDRAGEVEADIDGKFKGGNGGDRNNAVISAYGHFGVMERAIFGRPDQNKSTYDGGHLIEHTLMSGQDADQTYNLAPQENKHFNQSLMRGWERIPEYLQHHLGINFDYWVKVNYSGDAYTRTGQDLIDAKVFPASLLTALPPTGTDSLADLKTTTATFARWVPGLWEAEARAKGSSLFPAMNFTNGIQYHTLRPSRVDAEQVVVDPVLKTSRTHPSPLSRQNSGSLAAYIENMTSLATTRSLPSAAIHRAHMFQPEPQDRTDQPSATTSPWNVPMVALPPAPAGKKLEDPMSLAGLVAGMASIQVYKKNTGKMVKRLSDGTIDSNAKKASPNEYKLLRDKYSLTEKDGVKLARVLFDHPGTATKKDFIDRVNDAGLSAPGTNRLIAIANDVKFS